MKTVKYIIHGKVQGVAYRYSTLKKAQEIHIEGYVRNLPDRTVEIIARGNDDQLTDLYRWAQQGSPMAKVTSIDVQDILGGEYNGFEIR